jgi:hypothetical protein
LGVLGTAFVDRSAAQTATYQPLDRYPIPGTQPSTPLVEAANGRVYGCFVGADTKIGGVVRLLRDGSLAVAAQFSRSTGLEPTGLVATPNGMIFGSCQSGGEFDLGTIFRIDPFSGVANKIQDFYLNGGRPVLHAVGSDGTLYGTYANGVFSCTSSGVQTSVVSFKTGAPAPGVNKDIGSARSLIVGSDGNLYGTTGFLISSDDRFEARGVVFKITLGTAEVSELAPFINSTATVPVQIVEGSEGAEKVLYGVNAALNSTGTIAEAQLVRISQTSGGALVIGNHFGGTTGDAERGGVLRAPDGMIYALIPKRSNDPTTPDRIIKYTPSTGVSPVFTATTDPSQPLARLSFSANGTTLRGATDAVPKATSGLDKKIPPRAFKVIDFGGTIVNRPPYARNDVVVLPADSLSLTIRPLENDGDADGDALEIVSISGGTGTTAIDSDGQSLIYTRAASSTADEFTYTIRDESGSETGAKVFLRTAQERQSYVGFGTFDTFLEVPCYARVRVNPSGSLSGILYAAGRQFVLRGAFDTNDQFTQAIPTEYCLTTRELSERETDIALVTGNLNVTLTRVTDSTEITASLKLITADPGDTDPAGDFKLRPVPDSTSFTGRHTLTFPDFDFSLGPAKNPTRSPFPPPGKRPAALKGFGWAIFGVKNSRVRMLGHLPDGKSFSFGGPFSDADTLPIFVRTFPPQESACEDTQLPPPKGFFAGKLEFKQENNRTLSEGFLRWVRPAGIGSGAFESGISIYQPVAGCSYKPRLTGSAMLRLPPERSDEVVVQVGPFLGADDFDANGFADLEKVICPELGMVFELDGDTGLLRGTALNPEWQVPVTRTTNTIGPGGLVFSSAIAGSRTRRFPVWGVVHQQKNQILGQIESRYGTGSVIVEP